MLCAQLTACHDETETRTMGGAWLDQWLRNRLLVTIR
jgi:hypothetical protein